MNDRITIRFTRHGALAPATLTLTDFSPENVFDTLFAVMHSEIHSIVVSDTNVDTWIKDVSDGKTLLGYEDWVAGQ